MTRSELYNLLYLGLCRAYSRRFIKDKPADAVYRLLCGIQFYKEHRYWPHFTKPRTFEEKVGNRLLFDRRSLWTRLSDKWRAREWVAARIGSDYLVPMLWHGERAEEIPFDELPRRFIIKATHGCKWNLIVGDKEKIDQAQVRRQLGEWLGKNFCHDSFLGNEWAYRNIPPSLNVEELLTDNEKPPVDYKFFCFSGRAEFLQMSFDRFGDASEKFFDRSFRPLPVWNGMKLYPFEVARPDNYEEMLQVADTLSRGLDFIRVDLYSVGRRVYFGELTCYPAGGTIPFVPRKYDFLFGRMWNTGGDGPPADANSVLENRLE